MNEHDLEYWLGICTFLILEQGNRIMAELDDLNTNLAEVGTALDALEARVGTKTGVDPAAVEAAAQTAKGFADRINAILP